MGRIRPLLLTLVPLLLALACWHSGQYLFVSQPCNRRSSRIIMRNQPERIHRPYKDPFTIVRPMTFTLDELHDSLTEQQQKELLGAASPDVEERRALMAHWWRTLTGANCRPIMEAVMKALYDEDRQVRMDAANVLHRLGKVDKFNTDPWIAKVASRLARDTDAEVGERVISLEALAQIGSPAMCYSNLVGQNLEHENPAVRYAAVQCIGAMGPEGHFWKATLVRLMRDDFEEIRKAADAVVRRWPIYEPGWMKAQRPAWEWRLVKHSKGQRKTKPNFKRRIQ